MKYNSLLKSIIEEPIRNIELISETSNKVYKIKLVRIYAIFSSLNILAFLKKNGVDNLEAVIPYGNTYTFYELIKEHLKFLNLD